MCPQHLQKVLDFSSFFEDAARGLLSIQNCVQTCYLQVFCTVPTPPGVFLLELVRYR